MYAARASHETSKMTLFSEFRNVPIGLTPKDATGGGGALRGVAAGEPEQALKGAHAASSENRDWCSAAFAENEGRGTSGHTGVGFRSQSDRHVP